MLIPVVVGIVAPGAVRSHSTLESVEPKAMPGTVKLPRNVVSQSVGRRCEGNVPVLGVEAGVPSCQQVFLVLRCECLQCLRVEGPGGLPVA